MKKVRFIYNPHSGETSIVEWLDRIIEIYQCEGYQIVPYRLSFDEREVDNIFDGVDRSWHHVLIAGGDGSLNYVVSHLKRLDLDLPIAVLPSGTANDFAHMLRVPSDIERACHAILAGSERPIDLGRVNDEYFVNVFSCGLFTEVSQKTPTIFKNTFGKLAYYLGGLGELPKFRKMHISVDAAEGSYEGSSLIFFVFNGQTAGQMKIAYLSQPDDGLLDVIVVKGDNPIDTIRTIFHFIKRNKGDYPSGVLHFRSSDIRIESFSDESTDIDGQAGPRFPIHIVCERAAIRVLCPVR